MLVNGLAGSKSQETIQKATSVIIPSEHKDDDIQTDHQDDDIHNCPGEDDIGNDSRDEDDFHQSFLSLGNHV